MNCYTRSVAVAFRGTLSLTVARGSRINFQSSQIRRIHTQIQVSTPCYDPLQRYYLCNTLKALQAVVA